MAITTRDELRTALNTWLVRSESATQLDEFIQLGEAKLNRDLRLISMETSTPVTVTLSSGANVADLPTGFIELIALRWNDLDGPGPIQKPIDVVRNAYTSSTGRPAYAAVSGSCFVFERPADQAYTLKSTHLAKWALGTASSSANALLTSHPDAYLFAALAAAGIYTRKSPDGVSWPEQRDRVIADLNDNDARSRKIGATLTVDPGLTGRGGSRYDINRG
ncbi:MAG TPA: hypothetical protein VEA41_07295 [Salinarimonas sp.]|nr:hypothetical protein [Salinarimonas sp.]